MAESQEYSNERWKEVELVASAYINYNTRIKAVQKKLPTKIEELARKRVGEAGSHGSGLATQVSSQATPVKVTQHQQPSSSSDTPTETTPESCQKTTQKAANISSEVEKKHMEKFKKEMSKVVVKILDPYRKKGVGGHISNTDDFKHLAKKLTHSIMQKELRQCMSIDELKASWKVQKKASEYVKLRIEKYGKI